MQLISTLTKETAQNIEYILTDIDDTLTKDGKLLECAYKSLWDLKNLGLKVIPVTGRPAGWCDMIIRQWPVDAVVGENGAFAYYFEGSQLKTLYHPSIAPDTVKSKLEIVKKAVLEKIPESRVSKDQFARLFDLAIDFNEDPPHLGLETAEEIKNICKSFGAEAKISSIHVNTWFGKYDKLSMIQLILKSLWGIEGDTIKNKIFFCGDSPNDSPMFSYFKNTCGVANIESFMDILLHKPSYITTKSYGYGFSEAMNRIIKLKS